MDCEVTEAYAIQLRVLLSKLRDNDSVWAAMTLGQQQELINLVGPPTAERSQ